MNVLALIISLFITIFLGKIFFRNTIGTFNAYIIRYALIYFVVYAVIAGILESNFALLNPKNYQSIDEGNNQNNVAYDENMNSGKITNAGNTQSSYDSQNASSRSEEMSFLSVYYDCEGDWDKFDNLANQYVGKIITISGEICDEYNYDEKSFKLWGGENVPVELTIWCKCSKEPSFGDKMKLSNNDNFYQVTGKITDVKSITLMGPTIMLEVDKYKQIEEDDFIEENEAFLSSLEIQDENDDNEEYVDNDYSENTYNTEYEDDNIDQAFTEEDEYICAYASENRFANDDLDNLHLTYDRYTFPGNRSLEQMIVNEIYARHGYIFKSEDLSKYFNNQAWYVPVTNDMDEIYYELSDVEKDNIDYLKSFDS